MVAAEGGAVGIDMALAGDALLSVCEGLLLDGDDFWDSNETQGATARNGHHVADADRDRRRIRRKVEQRSVIAVVL
jgi:hypothetical protein